MDDAYNPFAAFLVDDAPEFTFERNLGTVTVQDRIATSNPDGSWTVSYQNPRTARIADNGTLVHYITPQCYFVYKNVFAFQKKQDDSCLAFEAPLSFSGLL